MKNQDDDIETYDISLNRAEIWILGEILTPLLEDNEGAGHWPFHDASYCDVSRELMEKFRLLCEQTFLNANTCGQCQWGYGCEACDTCEDGVQSR